MNLPPVFRVQYVNGNGVPLTGGQLFTYQAGTTTPQATYTDETGGTPNANPVILDSNGSASVWLNPALSYKFVLEDSLGNLQWSVDNVSGILTPNAVNTAAIQAGAVTGPCLASGSVNVTNGALASDASIDANRPVNTNNIRNGAITYPKFSSTFGIFAPTVQSIIATGTYNLSYLFSVSSANATIGATYSNNSTTFTVLKTIASGAVLWCNGPAAPSTTGTLTKQTGTGDATITFTAMASPLYLRVYATGGGGGGSGSGTSAGTAAGSGSATTFGSLINAAAGGAGGFGGAGGGGSGGSVSSPTILFQDLLGQAGGTSVDSTSSGAGLSSGAGGNTFFGGGGLPIFSAGVGTSGTANTGGGAAGAAAAGANVVFGGGGGGGETIVAIVPNPQSNCPTVSCTIGAGGTAGTTGGGGFSGGVGGSGVIIVEEHYQ